MRYFVWILILLFTQACSAQTITIVNDGQAVAKIVIPSNANAVEKEAANLLKQYIYQISGGDMPIIFDREIRNVAEILIGNTNRYGRSEIAGISEDGIYLKTAKDQLLINGGSRKGVLYAVYELLEKHLGCKRYTKDISFIPKTRTIRLGAINHKYSPPFTYRSVYSIDVLWDKSYADWHKLNFFSEGRGSYVHTFKDLLPSEQYFKNHSEYFALVEGKRVKDQPCLSHPAVFRIMKEGLQKLMNKNPGIKTWSVSHNDNLNYCHCNLCELKHKAGNGFSETLIPFVNKIANTFTNYTISTLAYNQSLLPPKVTKPLKNVEIMFCLTHINRAVPLRDAKDIQGVKFKNALNDWRKKTSNIFIWDYPVNYFHVLAPFPNIRTLKPNLLYFKTNGVAKVFEQTIGTQKGEMSELKAYLIQKLLWNPEENVELLKVEFLMNIYGKGWTDILSYLELIENESSKSGIYLDVWANPTIYKSNIFSEENMIKYNNYFESALRKAKDEKWQLLALEKEKLCLDYVELEIGRTDEKRFYAIGGLKAYSRKLQDFAAKANRLGVVKLMNDSRSPEEYVNGAIINVKEYFHLK